MPSRSHNLRLLVGLVTSHVALNQHQITMNIRTDALCQACGKEGETSYHFLGRCIVLLATGAYVWCNQLTTASKRFK